MSTQQLPEEIQKWIRERAQELCEKKQEEKKNIVKERLLNEHYFKRKFYNGAFFLVKQNQFIPLENLDDKLDDYRERLNSWGFKDSFAFQFDFRIMSLLKEYGPELKFLKEHYPDNLRNNMTELGADMLKLILFQPREEWEAGYEKIRAEFASAFEGSRKLPPTKMPPGESPLFIYPQSLLSEPIPSEEPTTWPEQDYLNKLMFESPEFKKTISDATKVLRAMWREIIPVDDARKTPIPYESYKPIAYLPDITIAASIAPVAVTKENYSAPATNGKNHASPITNQSDLLKALRVNGSMGISELEKGILEVPHDSAGDGIAVPPQVGKRLVDYNPKDCITDRVNAEVIRCKEAPNKYQECARAHHIYKAWQCCKPDN